VKAAESAFRNPSSYGARPDPGRPQVRRRHDAVPASRNGKNRPIRVHDSPRDARWIGVW
jgi:hypothetical protein